MRYPDRAIRAALFGKGFDGKISDSGSLPHLAGDGRDGLPGNYDQRGQATGHPLIHLPSSPVR
jgi:hypothetical protein